MLTRNYQHPGPLQPFRAGAINPRERTKGEQLLAEIEAFLRGNRHFSQSRFGREACANCELVPRLQQGLDPSEIVQRRVRKFIAENGG